MGQPVTVIENPSATPGVVRYDINRSITGTGHVQYRSADDAQGDRPPDRLARALFERGGVDAVHINSNVITVYLADGSPPTGIKAIIEEMFIYYREGVEVELPAGVPSA